MDKKTTQSKIQQDNTSSDSSLDELLEDDEDDEDETEEDDFILSKIIKQKPLKDVFQDNDDDDDDDDNERKKRKRINPLGYLNNKSKFIPIKQFDLGKNYDTKIVSSMEKLNELIDLANNSPIKSSVVDLAFDKSKKTYEERLKLVGTRINDSLIDMILKEHISFKYKDWHFIDTNYDPMIISEIFDDDELTFFNLNKLKIAEMIKLKIPNLNEFMIKCGCNMTKLNSLRISSTLSENNVIETFNQYDNFVEICPMEDIMKFLCYYDDDPNFIKIFICFILDRKVYETLFLDSICCTNIYQNVILKRTPQQKAEIGVDTSEIIRESNDENENNSDEIQMNKGNFIKIYFEVVDRENYLLHYRLIRLIPELQKDIINHLFENTVKNGNGGDDNIRIVEEFNNLFDNKQYHKLLYYILLIYGSDLMPFGHNKTTEYFKDCIYDMTVEGNNEVELSILKGILNIFYKITDKIVDVNDANFIRFRQYSE
ncbi:Smc5-Smc6 complex subunit KRE29 NDAI_0B06090 [Naumovozyma dairenensis CBS 421]|uniref:Uncharacterized protein n=1 Tax=Naumovozyma dairenensis (strain ATCC 10597 / BCRC 20456 / CBS 421 / NBRC 0211 / NRRL Y-12639) TaxID=1071378 RepID=G0W780_NAUDC|nr:hypothetical protein NDAI_0B06090 [Naumovozyma dairenensis CBS 421]CCD23641.1 hypothetical protein NDAI_0B06090 [Naumovozyma dairenensis CBS 421]